DHRRRGLAVAGCAGEAAGRPRRARDAIRPTDGGFLHAEPRESSQGPARTRRVLVMTTSISLPALGRPARVGPALLGRMSLSMSQPKRCAESGGRARGGNLGSLRAVRELAAF